ncbi:toprim domain-containing protein [Vibrio sp. R78045]|uniref:toprim domain-containing protein n=1 Tax=Vibrio sp. R78045 TaxID=3093868 RepID=UPI0036F1E5A5
MTRIRQVITKLSGAGNVNYVIVESRHIGRILQAHLDELVANTQVLATSGHLYDYKFHENKIHLVPIQTQAIDAISKLNGKNIIVATDPDPQGNLIAEHIKSLTPNSEHRRCIFSDLTKSGVLVSLNRFNKRQFEFDERNALKGALVKVANLHLRHNGKGNSGHYQTTTGIELAKQFANIGRVNNVTSRTFERNGVHYRCNVPSSFGEATNMGRPSPIVTKQIIANKSLEGRSLNVADHLQDAFINGRLSYTRTDFSKLPAFSEKIINEYTTNGDQIDIDHHLEFNGNAPHYAIHNLAAPFSPLERMIQIHNQSSLVTKYNDTNIVTFENGHTLIASANEHCPTRTTLPPANECAVLLSLSSDSSPAILESSGARYAKHFYNGNQLNQPIISNTLNIAEKHFPALTSQGLDATLEKALDSGVSLTDSLTHLELDNPSKNKKSQEINNGLLDSIEFKN